MVQLRERAVTKVETMVAESHINSTVTGLTSRLKEKLLDYGEIAEKQDQDHGSAQQI